MRLASGGADSEIGVCGLSTWPVSAPLRSRCLLYECAADMGDMQRREQQAGGESVVEVAAPYDCSERCSIFADR